MTLFLSLKALSTNSLNAISRSHFTTNGFLSTVAQQVFDEIPKIDPSETEHKTLLFEYSQNGLNRKALGVFLGLHRSGYRIDGSTLSCTLKVCGCLFDQATGKQIHCQCVKSGLLDDVSVGTSLVDMYMKTEDVRNGKRVFDEMGVKNVVSWTALLTGYAQNGLNQTALELFCRMHRNRVKPNPLTFATLFGALTNLGVVDVGSQIHTLLIKSGHESSTFVSNSLINMYSNSGTIRLARVVFDCLEGHNRDGVTWNSMISGYVTNKLDFEALRLFHSMRLVGEKLTQPVFASVIKSCSNLGELGFARQLHGRVVKSGFGSDGKVGTALMTAYSKCDETDGAFEMFSSLRSGRSVVSWTAMIGAFLKNGAKERAVRVFFEMLGEGVSPNEFTYSTVLTAQPYVSVPQIHAKVVKTRYEKSQTVGTALLSAYVKIGNVEQASKVFESIDEKDIVAWSAMLFGYAQTGETERAVEIFRRLSKEEGIRPNEYTFSIAIHASSAGPTASAEQGRQFHGLSIKARLDGALCVSSALVTMYAKRGDIESAERVFRRQRERDLVSWNSMVSGFAQHGRAERALEVFEDMKRRGMELDGVTFIAVITACTHSGLVEKGQRHFDSMVKRHKISPKMEHYSCLVDLYGRAGVLERAVEVIDSMPFAADETVWRTLLSACHVRRNLNLGKFAAEKLTLLRPQDSSAYVLLSNIYASAGKWKERAAVRKKMDEMGVKKEAGFSWIEVKNKTYSFMAGDISNPFSSQIYSKLEELSTRLKGLGYEPDTSFVLHDVEEEQKETILSRHSERLAIAFGLVSTPRGTLIRVTKNLRVCGDCHNVIKLVSSIERREIVVRDSNRFHHFKDGVCSCGDYW